MTNAYMIAFYMKYFPGNVYINTACLAVADFFAYVLTGFVLAKTDVKTTFLIS